MHHGMVVRRCGETLTNLEDESCLVDCHMGDLIAISLSSVLQYFGFRGRICRIGRGGGGGSAPCLLLAYWFSIRLFTSKDVFGYRSQTRQRGI